LAFSYWFNKPWFLTEGKLAAVLIIPYLGVPNLSVIYINTAPQSEVPIIYINTAPQSEVHRKKGSCGA
jgi:hypothetical protein